MYIHKLILCFRDMSRNQYDVSHSNINALLILKSIILQADCLWMCIWALWSFNCKLLNTHHWLSALLYWKFQCRCHAAANGLFQRSVHVLLYLVKVCRYKRNCGFEEYRRTKATANMPLLTKEEQKGKSPCSDANTTGLLEGEPRSQGFCYYSKIKMATSASN